MSDLHQQIAALETDIQKKKDELLALRRKMPKELVANHELKDDYGLPITLRELFGNYKDLIVIHNMGQACAYCTLWADGLNGFVPHILTRSALALVSPDEPNAMRAFAESRGWKFPMISSKGSDFSKALGFETEEGALPGFSAFRLNDDETISRVGFAHFGPGDDYCGIWFMLGLLQDGLAGWSPKHVRVD